MSQCQFLVDFVDSAYPTTCNTFLKLIDSLWVICISIAILFSVVVPLMILGLKRWDSANKEDQYVSRNHFLPSMTPL
jgi:hypothetical protein